MALPGLTMEGLINHHHLWSNLCRGWLQVRRRQGLEGSLEFRGEDRQVDGCHALGRLRQGAVNGQVVEEC